jgi:hypothetical protein
MHIEFRLPTGAGGQAAVYSCSVINRELAAWCASYGFEHSKTISHYKIIVEFPDPRAYTMFALTWQVQGIRVRISNDTAEL